MPDGAGKIRRLADRAGTPLALWGGHECTVNRVGDRFLDQTVRTGHEHRLDDLDRFAELGLRTLRYPVLWERTSPERPDLADWSWSDVRLGRLRELGVAPIAGLVHHGSGPRYTHLLDDGFAPGLAAHARAAAERYPWVTDWTPVNEPLTTARFACLYGHWHPHARDEYALYVALLNEVDATRLAMRAVRAVNPAARLVQTEDLGHVFATDPLLPQADFENIRRWLSFDLLCGRVTPGHPFFGRLERLGLGDRLRAAADDPCPPDVIGINSYLSSERMLDHRVDGYPASVRGGNYDTPYADVEAVRAVAPGPLGVERLMELAWARYGLPLAVTERHLGCTREEQMRWLQEGWDAALSLRERGVRVEAVTVWSLLGALDWNSLLTRDAGDYEPGVFDVRSGSPRPTALAGLVRRLATGRGEPHPAQAGPGWWRRDIRLQYAPTWCGQTAPVARAWSPPPAASRPVLVAGAGRLGRAVARALEHRGHAYLLADRARLDVTDAAAVGELMDALLPWAVVNTVGPAAEDLADADWAERADRSRRFVDGASAAALAQACARRGVRLLGFSSAEVFDGTKAVAYDEEDAPSPVDAYGRSCARAELAFAAAGGSALMVRTGPLFSPLEPADWARGTAEALAAGRPFSAGGGRRMSPTLTSDLVDAALDLLIDGETGVRHLANRGCASLEDFAGRLAAALGVSVLGAERGPDAAPPFDASGTRRTELATLYGDLMPTLESSVERYAAAVRPLLTFSPRWTLADAGAVSRRKGRGVSAAAL